MTKFLEGVGYTLRQGPDGVSIELDNPGAAGGAGHPFKIRLIGLKFKVTPGSVNSVVPTLDGTALDAATPPSKTISATGDVYLKCTNTAGAFFPAAVTVEYGTTPTSTDSYLYIQLGTITVTSGTAKRTAQLVETSLAAEYLKCGDAAGEYFTCRA